MYGIYCLMMALRKGRNKWHPLLCNKGVVILDGECTYCPIESNSMAG
jgi:hypothetical protein